jgi:prepilin-type N-terminal cleavage/methylation domain-containing protein
MTAAGGTMPDRNGFTLIETLITMLVLVTGLAAVAALFAYGSQSSGRLRQQTAALALLASKMEELKGTEESAPGQYSEYLAVASDGVPAPRDARQASYLRTWEITPEMPRRITVIVYGKQPGRDRPDRELARATTQSGRGF